MRLLTILCVVAAACGGRPPGGAAHATPPARPDGPPPLAVGSYVLLWQNAWLSDGAPADATGQANRARVGDATDRVVGDVVVLRVVADHGDTVDVANVHEASWEDHCHGYVHELEDYDLTMTANRADLAPVTVQPVTTSFDGDTAITLRAGVALGGSATLREVYVNEVRLSLPVAADAVGIAYQPSPALNANVPVAGTLKAGVVLRYGDQIVDEHPEVMDVFAEVPVPQGARLTIATRCLQLRVLAPAGSVDYDGGGFGMGGFGAIAPTGLTVAAGTTVTWPDGRVAGKTIADTRLDGRPMLIDARTCFPKPIGWPVGPDTDAARVGALMLCFPNNHFLSANP